MIVTVSLLAELVCCDRGYRWRRHRCCCSRLWFCLHVSRCLKSSWWSIGLLLELGNEVAFTLRSGALTKRSPLLSFASCNFCAISRQQFWWHQCVCVLHQVFGTDKHKLETWAQLSKIGKIDECVRLSGALRLQNNNALLVFKVVVVFFLLCWAWLFKVVGSI